MKVYQQSDGQAAHTQIAQQLRLVGRRQRWNRLDFKDNLVCYKYIRAKTHR
jgi:hypothetical protein